MSTDGHVTVQDRIAGALLGLAAGDALGATLEFVPPHQIVRRHTEIRGGGAFSWRAGQGTDDTDLTWAVLQGYLDDYTVEGVAGHMLAWYRGGPRDIGGTTQRALSALVGGADPRNTGLTDDRSAANGSLMRCLPTGLVRPDAERRRAEAAQISRITHAEVRCVDACVAYCDLVDALLRDATPSEAVATVLAGTPDLGAATVEALQRAGQLALEELDTSGYVTATLTVGVWALLQPRPAEDTLMDVVNRGLDADTTGAVAGGLLGCRDGVAALSARWTDKLEYRAALLDAVPAVHVLRVQRENERAFLAAVTAPTDADWRALWTAVDEMAAGSQHPTWPDPRYTVVIDGREEQRMELPHVEYSDAVHRVVARLHGLGLIVPFDWGRWDGFTLFAGGEGMQEAPVTHAVRMVTAIVRAERFNTGTIDVALRDGTFLAALNRLRVWHEQRPRPA